MIIAIRILNKVMLLELWLIFLLAHLFPIANHFQISLSSFPQGISALLTFGSSTILQTLLDKKGIP